MKEKDSINTNETNIVMDNKSIIGEDPTDFINHNVQQTYPDTCAIKSQQLILEDFGINMTEDQLVAEAINQGIYAPGGGTLPQDVGKLLENHGVDVEVTENGSIIDLSRALAEGHKVIIGVDSGELWKGGIFEFVEDLFQPGADHALIVAGIDVASNEVILTDPGSGEEGARYPLDKFLDAWEDSGNFMVETAQPVPLEFCPEMAGFNYELGHIENIGHMPYSYFEQTVLPINDALGVDFSFHDSLFNDFANMVCGGQFGFSPSLIEAVEDISMTDITPHDLTEEFESYVPDIDIPDSYDLNMM